MSHAHRDAAALAGAGLVSAVGGPVLVAWLRRSAVWALSPVAIFAVLAVGWRIHVFQLNRSEERAQETETLAARLAPEVDRILAYQPPPHDGATQPTRAEQRRAFDAAVERAKPALQARGFTLTGVRTDGSGEDSIGAGLTIVYGGRTMRLSYHVTDPTAQHTYAGAC